MFSNTGNTTSQMCAVSQVQEGWSSYYGSELYALPPRGVYLDFFKCVQVIL